MRIRLEELRKSFGEQQVLNGINFDAEVSTLALIGPSGGGKSTLLRIIGGLEDPTSGQVTVDGADVDYRAATLPIYRASLGFVFQHSGLFSHMTAIDNIALPLRAVHGFTQVNAVERAQELLSRFGLASAASKYPAQLSGGERQRIAIARAVAPGPRLLLLDEPTSALDPEYTAEVLSLIDSLRDQGTRFIIVTHEMGFARRACDKVAFLNGGLIHEYGASTDVFGAPVTPELGRFLGRLSQWS